MYGARWCPDCKRAKQFLGEQRVTFRWVDINEDEAGRDYVREINDGKQIIPTIVFEDGSLLVEPSNAELAAKLNINPKAERSFYNLTVIGGGPAGLTSAIYAAREGIDILIIERSGVGGQVGVTERIDNYPGFPDGIAGGQLAAQMRAHAERFGVEILPGQSVTSVQAMGDSKLVTTETGDEYCSDAVIIATGSRYRRLNLPGEEDLIGAGIHFCATCDGPFYKGQEMLVIGGGNSGVEEGLFLTKFATKVTIVEFADRLGASQILQDKAAENPKIEIRTSTAVQEFRGQNRLDSVLIKDLKSGEIEEINPAAAFVFIGLDPNTSFLGDSVELDKVKFIKTGENFCTSIPGIYAAGDVRAGSMKQVTGAVGEGSTAAMMVRHYMERLQTTRGYRGD
ncbi:MAG: FAD-dependent oxidoreductase [SAR202 cluster bacterium]|nr:FAD-dependent oxidoreductase [SAR202 cluster bacterium]